MFDKSVYRNLTFCDISGPVYLKRRLYTWVHQQTKSSKRHYNRKKVRHSDSLQSSLLFSTFSFSRIAISARIRK